uniref:Uncharacterized protein n=1 Tax=Arundo donax TaxID=35708 RepID=A0A0A9D2M1_ARUDO
MSGEEDDLSPPSVARYPLRSHPESHLLLHFPLWPNIRHGRKHIIISPSPVAPQAPTSSSPYEEDPGIGPSPTLPGILNVAPLVDVPTAM